MIGNYHVLSKLNYREKQVYSMDYGWLYKSYEYIHVNYDIKCLDGNKPIAMTHYNCLYRWKAEIVDSAGTLKWSEKAVGFLRIVDPQASNLAYHGHPRFDWLPWALMGFTPFVTKFMDHRPVIEDAVKLTEMIFNNIDFALIPLIKYIEIRDINGNSVQIDVDIF